VLKQREMSKHPIKVGLIGCGEMGKGILNQINFFTPGIKLLIIYNRTLEKSVKACYELGIKNYKIDKDVESAEKNLEKGKIILTDRLELLFELTQIDVLIEATGTISFASATIMQAFKAGKHVLSFNAELDSTLGPVLYHKSKEYNVKYALGDGDQPGVIMNLYRYVRMMGFKPMVCGNIKGMQDRYRTPDTQKAFAAKWGMNPCMATNFADGTKLSFEQSCVANATGMGIAKRGMIGPESVEHIDKLTHLFDFEQLKSSAGIVDYIVGAQPSPGVFVFASCEDTFSRKYLEYGKMGKGPLYSFYTPYHLLFFDIASSVSRMIDFDDPVVIPIKGSVVDVIAVAKTDLFPGDILDGIGGFKAYGLCENHSVRLEENLLPMGLAEGCVIKKRVKKDSVITYNDVEIPRVRLIDELMELQNRLQEN
ncbi:MAG: NAD(P)H-dependent oxidoreductase, partial [Bacteroidota bacterium]